MQTTKESQTVVEEDIVDDVFSHLNEQQLKAAKFGDDPLLIIAGAGTGKTTTLAHRVAHLIAEGADPSRILLLTFTRRASAELLRRVDSILSKMQNLSGTHSVKVTASMARRVWGGTFHAVASRLLRQHGKLIGLAPGFTILDRSDAEDLINTIRTEMNLAKSETRFPLKATCLSIYSRCVNAQRPLKDILKKHFPFCEEHAEALDILFQKYVDLKEAQSVLDYDDLLLFWQVIVSEPETTKLFQEKFDYILVDEYQDTNTLQAEILKHLAPTGKGMTIVGDDAQSIYSFRSATVRNILDFPKMFPNVSLIPLEQNYRSTQGILAATNNVIAQATERLEKELWSSREVGLPPRLIDCQDEDEQTDYIIEQIMQRREEEVLLKEQAVLFRSSHHSLNLEVELTRRNIPFHKYGGLKFMETAHIKDLLAFLKLAENPRDGVAAARVLTLLPGIGPKKAQQLIQVLHFEGGSGSPFECWKDVKIPTAAKKFWSKFMVLLKKLSKDNIEIPAAVYSARQFYAPILELKFDNAKTRMKDLEQLELVAARFPSRSVFLEEITLDPPASTQDTSNEVDIDEDYLVLSTIHSAKGLEWESVYVLQATDGSIPSDMTFDSPEEIEEERRLFYVALTRAKNRLFVFHPQRSYHRYRTLSDSHGYTRLTRFLPDNVLKSFERLPASIHVEDDTSENLYKQMSTSAIRKRIKKMW
ncbi:ATP-dependent DNA helicase UvrD/PcrA, proteobacterial paralog [hydrothermal vent metagenome]|uniref:DNA 3'-5' helicase n=1 Tax=hydrothermal vent metagenome TaxID=652676 RepID=A0A3B1DK34_9ZZZZ